jgi:phosphoadenosine phosphosulfate reductase
MNKLKEIEKLIDGKSAEEILKTISSLTSEQITFSTSLGFEDQVIAHLIFKNNFPISVFTLDTGRLFPETYSGLNSTLEKYKKPIEVFYPQTSAVEKLLSEKGPFSFYNSQEARKECCYIRKVEPLQRALKGKSIWITGIRAEQSASRGSMKMVEWDDTYQLIKIHPLLNWGFEETKQFVTKNNIPYNALHDKGFVSIGCQPCTRAIRTREDFRAGRWWWETSDKKECGLHIKL